MHVRIFDNVIIEMYNDVNVQELFKYCVVNIKCTQTKCYETATVHHIDFRDIIPKKDICCCNIYVSIVHCAVM